MLLPVSEAFGPSYYGVEEPFLNVNGTDPDLSVCQVCAAEACLIIRELEKRSGLPLALNRNFRIVVDLGGR